MVDILFNSTIYNNFTSNIKYDCGIMRTEFADKVNTTFKWVIIIIPLLIIFKWWAIEQIVKSKESNEKKQFLVSFTNIFIGGVLILLCFYMIYWTFLSGLDF
jgi:uncharacterized membrane protein